MKCWRGCEWLSIKQALGIEATPGASHSYPVDNQREALERKQTAEGAAKLAADWWRKAKPANPEHFYLKLKKIPPQDIRQLGETLLVPLYRDGGLRSLQMIQRAEPQKAFLAGTDKAGCYFPLGRPNGCIWLCEGYATAATIHLATTMAVACAFDSGNLMSAAKSLRAKYPATRLIIAADDDWKSPVNVGMDTARRVATALNADIAIPRFTSTRGDKDSDFNDVLVIYGIEEVQRQLRELFRRRSTHPSI